MFVFYQKIDKLVIKLSVKCFLQQFSSISERVNVSMKKLILVLIFVIAVDARDAREAANAHQELDWWMNGVFYQVKLSDS